MSNGGNGTPTSLFRYEEDILLGIRISIIFKPVAFSNKFLISLVKGCGNISKKDKSDDYLSIFRCRNMPPQDASRIPQLFFKADVGIGFISHLNNLLLQIGIAIYDYLIVALRV